MYMCLSIWLGYSPACPGVPLCIENEKDGYQDGRERVGPLNIPVQFSEEKYLNSTLSWQNRIATHLQF